MMQDLKLQMQCFALLGRSRKAINQWWETGDKSPGSVNAMKVRLEQMIKEIDGYLESDDWKTDI